MATDGGVRQTGSCGWVIATKEGEYITKGSSTVFGTQLSSYRAELMGILTALTYLGTISEYFQAEIPPATIHSDSKSALARMAQILHRKNQQSVQTTTGELQGDYDILYPIETIIMKWKTRLKFVHVKAHQDVSTKAGHLSIAARLNIEADRLATEHMENNQYNGRRVPRHPAVTALLHHNTGSITRKIPTQIRKLNGYLPLKARIMKKWNWTEETFETVNWEAHGASINKTNRRVQITKFIHGLTPTNTTRHKYGLINSPTCPRCGIHEETTDHVMTCQHQERAKWRNNLLKDIGREMSKMQTAPEIKRLIQQGLRSWMEGSVIERQDYPRSLETVMEKQTIIG
ncbi:MAG: RNase H family protein, partial [Bacteroidota bacterium]